MASDANIRLVIHLTDNADKYRNYSTHWTEVEFEKIKPFLQVLSPDLAAQGLTWVAYYSLAARERFLICKILSLADAAERENLYFNGATR